MTDRETLTCEDLSNVSVGVLLYYRCTSWEEIRHRHGNVTMSIPSYCKCPVRGDVTRVLEEMR